MTKRLRILVFTAGEMTRVDRVFYERLASDPLIDFVGIIVDDYRRERKPLFTRIAQAIRADGFDWIRFKILTRAAAIANRLLMRIGDRIHGPARAIPPLRIPITHVPDIHSPASVALIRSLKPELGVIVGGRILRDSVIAIPTSGTLNIHKRKLPDYRGGGPVGYWELLAGEREIGVSIHYATSRVDAGPIVAQSKIAIEERDTLASLRLKADLRGTQLYYEAIRKIARGEAVATPQDLTQGTTYRAPSEYKVWRMERRKNVSVAQLRVALQFLLLLPLLQRVRRRLIREHRAPIAIFFYHLVTNRAVNHMCLPLEQFARQVEFLQRYYDVISLDEVVERTYHGANNRIGAAITFDDGYRDNAWAIEYLRYFKIPATFFVSIGHVLDGTTFEHDRRRGYEHALPMTPADVRYLAADGFTIGSHAMHHEDLGSVDAAAADRILRESRDEIEKVCGRAPAFFAFPKGQRGVNITRACFASALNRYDAIFSAYGGYAYPPHGGRHFLRIPAPMSVFDMNLAMNGYNGFRDCLAGNAWGLRTETLNPCAVNETSIALIAASSDIVGGHSIQAQTLSEQLREAGYRVRWIPVDARFPRLLQPLRCRRFVRTLINEALYLPSLLRIARADIVHIFAASYWSFLLGPAPAIVMGKLFRKRVIVHYHSGEANDHLTNWRSAAPLLRLADELVVPSDYLQRIFAAHNLDARVVPNAIDTRRFAYRERTPLRPRLLSVRNLDDYYRVDNTIKAFARLQQSFPQATLTIAGHGPHEARLRELARNIDGITFLGRVNPNELPSLYDAHDIFVNSSAVDNQPVSILEAMSAGLPVVSTPTGDIAAMLRHGEAGVLVERDDPCAMAAAIVRLIDDPSTALRLTRTARKEVDKYRTDRVVELWTALYEGHARASADDVTPQHELVTS